MLLKEFSFKDKCTGWELAPTTFDPLTLFVGASGVGKTKILEAIKVLSGLASGRSYNGIQWRAVFSEESLGEVVWEGETECVAMSAHDRVALFPFLSEKMTAEGKEIFSRVNSDVMYRGEDTVKLQNTKSLVSVFSDEDISKLCKSFRKIDGSADALDFQDIVGMERLYLINRGTSRDLIDSEVFSSAEKMFICSAIFPEIFNSIKNVFIEIFPFVQTLRFVEFGAAKMKALQLKEAGSDVWVFARDFSSGMRKTLSLLAAICLSPTGSIFLVDEFENSFGVNCIDSITDKMIEESSRIQFILSSHHPYIINNINSEHWRLVTRKGSVVSAGSVNDGISTKSRHEKFMQLINMDSFVDGIEQ